MTTNQQIIFDLLDEIIKDTKTVGSDYGMPLVEFKAREIKAILTKEVWN